MSQDKKTILILSDHPLSPSGVGTQTKYFIEAMLATGKYRFICMGGAIKHQNYQPIKVDPYGDDWVIFPIDGYGSQDLIRNLLVSHKPDVLWFMTDPRFYGWLWEIENEVRDAVPMVYYHVWDNYPYPQFNRRWYESTDYVATISKVTSDIVQTVAPSVKEMYIPHMVNTDIFKKQTDAANSSFRQESFKIPEDKNDDFTLFFWNNRNARRKMPGTIIWWFKEFLDKVGHDNARLVMHTDPKDAHGQDLIHILERLGLTDGQVMLSTQKMAPGHLAMLYSAADCTINISDAEGFGLATFESLACETPIIVNMTGGLQEQVTDGENWFGIGIEPTSKGVIGSQDVPYIYEDRVGKEDFINALVEFHNLTREEREQMGSQGRDHVLNNYSAEQFAERWDQLLTEVIEEFGSWKNRKGYQSWSFEEVA
jgi:glycosyltransferase involved in cell wall biosynthesis